MRFIVTFCLQLITVIAFAQTNNIDDLLKNRLGCGIVTARPDTLQTTIRLRCATTAQPPATFVIDGVVVEKEEWKNIDPATIESVTVLKPAPGGTGLFHTSPGFVIVTTRKLTFPALVIKELENVIVPQAGAWSQTASNILPGATVQFTSVENKTVRMYIADSEGRVYGKDLVRGEIYDVLVTSVGHKPKSFHYRYYPENTAQEILLEKNEVTGPEVVIVGYPTTRCRCLRGCGGACRLTKVISQAEEQPPVKQFIVYPNPLARGNSFTIDINTAEQQAAFIRIHGRDGKLVWEQSVQTVKGPNRFTVNTDARWAAGVYFLRMINRTGHSIKNEQVLIQ